MDSVFFEPEIRSGYLVSSEIKKLWAVQLDLLHKFDEFCKQCGLRYYADGGTLLGAVRHKGFIPWDDDIDIVMLWDDYQVLVEKAPEYFKDPYFFQSDNTEAEKEPTHSKLRRSDTTGCTQFELECITADYNRGIFIDIFPLFDVPDDEDKRIKQREEIMRWWKLYKGYEIHREKLKNGISKLDHGYDQYEALYLSMDPRMSFQEIKKKYVNACATHSGECNYLAPLSFRANNPRLVWPKSWYAHTAMLQFETMEIPCPGNYLERLSCQYGDWETPVMNAAMHEMGVIDTETSYHEKLRSRFVRNYFSTDHDEVLSLLRASMADEYSEKVDLKTYISEMNHKIMIAEESNQIEGCAIISIDSDGLGNDRIFTVSTFAVDSRYYENETAEVLLTEIEKNAKAYGCSTIEIKCLNRNIEKSNFFLSHNYERVEDQYIRKI